MMRSLSSTMANTYSLDDLQQGRELLKGLEKQEFGRDQGEHAHRWQSLLWLKAHFSKLSRVIRVTWSNSSMFVVPPSTRCRHFSWTRQRKTDPESGAKTTHTSISEYTSMGCVEKRLYSVSKPTCMMLTEALNFAT